MIDRFLIKAICLGIVVIAVWWLWPFGETDLNGISDDSATTNEAPLVSSVKPISHASASDQPGGSVATSLGASIASPLLSTESNQQLKRRFTKANTLLERGSDQQAIETLNSIIVDHPNIVESYINLAAIYAEKDQLERARQTLVKGFEANQNTRMLFKSLQEVHGALASSAYQRALDAKAVAATAKVSLPVISSLDTNLDKDRIIATLREQVENRNQLQAESRKSEVANLKAELDRANNSVTRLETDFQAKLAEVTEQLSVQAQKVLASQGAEREAQARVVRIQEAASRDLAEANEKAEVERSVLFEEHELALIKRDELIAKQQVSLEQQSVLLDQKTALLDQQSVSLQEKTAALEQQSIALQNKSEALERQSMALQEKTVALEQQSIVLQEKTVALEQQSVVLREKTVALGQQSELLTEQTAKVTALSAKLASTDLAAQQAARAAEAELQQQIIKAQQAAQAEQVAKAELTKAEVAKAELAKAEQLAKAEFAKAELAKAEQLAKAELAKAELAKAELAKAELAKAELAKAELAKAELAKAELAKAQAQEIERQAAAALSDQKSKREKMAVALVKGWSSAWSAQDVSDYVSYYVDSYTSGPAVTRQQWLEQRHLRLTNKEFIDVTVSDFSVKDSGSQFVVTFTQHYRSDRIDDTIRKRLIFTKQGDDWSNAKISSEQVVSS